MGGQAAGGAVADILTGAVNPSAKFAETWPERIEHNPSYLSFPGDDEVVYSEGIFVGYRYYDKKGIKPLFPFGHGLTYSNFEYLDITVDKFSVDEYEPVKVTVEIKNSGDMDGSEIVQLYVADVKSKVTRPIRELKGFEKVFLKAGETKKVSFTLNRRSFAYWDAVSHGWVVESGKFNIEVGPSSACLPLDVEIEVKAKELPIRPITRDTTVGQIMAIPGGAEIVMQMFQNVSQTLGVGDSSESDQATQSEDQSDSPFGGMDMQALLAGMPLRTLATFSGGKMDNTMLEGLIQMLNQKLLGE